MEVVRGTAAQFARDDDPHGVLARLKLPLYLTTNYDDFMVRALIACGADARWDICRWNDSPAVKAVKTPLRRPYVPSPERPLVFHLHGHYQVPQSLVITEDDYLEFLAAIIRDEKQRLLPPPLPERVTGTALLFVGYSLTDWTFRVLLRSLKNSFTARLGYPALAIQLDPADVADKESLAEARNYLTRYLGEVGLRSRLRIAWGKAGDFARELEGRLNP